MNSVARGCKIVRYTALLGAVLVLASGCAEDQGNDKPESEKTTSSEAPAGPTVTVDADKTHAVQPGDEITVTVSVDKFTLDAEKIGKANELGIGYYRVYMDDALDDDFLAESAANTVKVTVPDDITDGSHQLRVVLYNNDGSPLAPVVQGDVWLIVYRL